MEEAVPRPPYSKQFDDIYYSADDGLAETMYVFLKGNGLPDAWKDVQDIRICETGFGTGLNFLATWKLFRETARPDQSLTFISFEQFPLSAQDIASALMPWVDELGCYTEQFLSLYPATPENKWLAQLDENVFLEVYFQDMNTAIKDVQAPIHFWYLDGFKPATNPEMWTEILFDNMGRLSVPGSRVATYTAAGIVKRGLEGAGFKMEKPPGFGRKREMLVGSKA